MNENSAKILIVEDDENLAQNVAKLLNENDFRAEIFSDFENFENSQKFFAQISAEKFDLILLDLNLPNFRGEKILKKIREKNEIPIIILTAENSETNEIITRSFGADDFVAKPFNAQILLLRIENILARKNRNFAENLENLSYKNLSVNLARGVAKFEQNEIILTKNELAILIYFLKNPRKILSRAQIMDRLWSDEKFVDDNTLTVNMTRLRAKLTDIGAENFVKTRRGLGYVLE